MAIETLAARTGATPLRIRRVQKITLTLLFIAGIVNFLDRSSLSVAGEAIRADQPPLVQLHAGSPFGNSCFRATRRPKG